MLLFVVYVPNATVGVNTIVKNLILEPEDILLLNSHTYSACTKVSLSSVLSSLSLIVVL